MSFTSRFFFLIPLFLIVGQIGSAQKLLPPITNYSSKTYNGASQNWDLSSDANGVIYAANNDGLLHYDGERWQLYTLPNKTIIRSVFCLGEKIFTGSYEEFGYWQTNAFGVLEYTSLTPLLNAYNYANEEFWEIIAFENGVAFRSFGKVYIYNGETIRSFTPQFIVTSICSFDGALILGSLKGKLYRLENEKIVPYSVDALPREAPVAQLTVIDGVLTIGTRVEGVYSLKNKKIEVWQDQEIQDFLVKNELNAIYPFKDGKIAFGTIKGGLLLYDTKTGETSNYYRGNGLENNTVLSIHASNQNLWAGLDNGLERIDLSGKIAFYTEKTGELGAVYDIARMDSAVYLGSNTGVHRVENGQRTFVHGSQGQVWSFTKIKDKLLVNHNRGLFEINRDSLTTISTETGSYSTSEIPEYSGNYINATYNGMRFVDATSSEIKTDSILPDFNTPLNNVVFQNASTIWVSHPYKGFYKMNIDASIKKIRNIETYGNDSIFSAFKTGIHQIKNQLAFYNGGNWYIYNPISDVIQDFEALNYYTDYELISDSRSGFWFKNRKGTGLIYTDFLTDSIFIEDQKLEDDLIKGYERVEQINDSMYYVALNDGYALLNLNRYRILDTTKTIATPLVNSFEAQGKNFVITQDEDARQIDYKSAALITVRFSSPAISNSNFYYELSSGEKGFLNEGNLQFQNLAPDTYILKIWSVLNGLKSTTPLKLKFRILQPWYFSRWAIGIYVLMIMIIVASIYAVNKQKLNKHRRELEMRIAKEQERKIQVGERNKLLAEINLKRQELANSTYQAAQRNKALIDIKKELEDVKDNFDNTYKYKTIENKINSMVEGKDNWKVFETNFKEVNQDFFSDLLRQYPDLSSKDLKLCAYLKMNLSTKEIAPLMSISIRGVEIHRYRLRKKLNLKTTKNLSRFLIKNF